MAASSSTAVGRHDDEQTGGDHADHSADVAGDAAHAGEGDYADPMEHYLNPGHLIAHVQDGHYFEIPALPFLGFDGKVYVPNLFGTDDKNPVIAVPDNDYVMPITFRPTKFMILELIAALILAVLFIGYARRVRDGSPPRGKLWNMIEAMVVYVRDQIGKPAIGKMDAERYMPFLWTIFFFILAMNLLGLIPFLGSPTGSLGVTVTLALIVFAVVVYSGSKKLGVLGFLKSLAPHMELPFWMAIVLVPMIWAIEAFGMLIKHTVLAVRLFANMFAGHLVLAVFVAFIGVVWGNTILMVGVVPTAVAASVAILLLELLVAFIQAYVFAFLAALFIGMALHPH